VAGSFAIGWVGAHAGFYLGAFGRAVVLTPSDPDGFVRAVTERLPWSARNGLEDGGTPALQPAALDTTLPARSRSEDTQSSLRRKES
jgi:hypothetical protein